MMHVQHKVLILHLLTCLGRNALGSKIINGQIAPPNSLQFMASLQLSDGRHNCGGSLISDQFVLTAAHCDHLALTKVILGTHDLRNPGTVRGIAQKCKHPDFVHVSRGNDIMLLKLSQSVPVSETIQHIGLPPPGMTVHDNQNFSVAGWGMNRTGGPTVDDLRVVNVSVINKYVCRQKWSEVFLRLPANIICAGGYQTNKGFCQGDSGGPLMYKGTAAGVVSFNYGINNRGNCDYPNFPNVYTDVSKFRPWIDKVVKENGC